MKSNIGALNWLDTAVGMALALLACAPLHAEPAIAVLLSQDSAPYKTMLEGFQAQLRDHGVQASYEVLQAGGDRNKATQLARQIAAQEAELVYCLGTLACQSVRQSISGRPVVASLVLTLESSSPETQVTGVTLNYLPETQLHWLTKLFPQFKRVGVIYNPEQNQVLIDQAKQVANNLGVKLVAIPIDKPKELPLALKNLLREIDILWAVPDRVVLAPQTAKEVLLTSFRNRIPVIGASAPWVKGGALYALDWDYRDMGAQNADIALKILNGTPINRMPVEEPRTVSYTMNRKTAKHMKLDVPEEIVRRAKHVYQ